MSDGGSASSSEPPRLLFAIEENSEYADSLSAKRKTMPLKSRRGIRWISRSVRNWRCQHMGAHRPWDKANDVTVAAEVGNALCAYKMCKAGTE